MVSPRGYAASRRNTYQWRKKLLRYTHAGLKPSWSTCRQLAPHFLVMLMHPHQVCGSYSKCPGHFSTVASLMATVLPAAIGHELTAPMRREPLIYKFVPSHESEWVTLFSEFLDTWIPILLVGWDVRDAGELRIEASGTLTARHRAREINPRWWISKAKQRTDSYAGRSGTSAS